MSNQKLIDELEELWAYRNATQISQLKWHQNTMQYSGAIKTLLDVSDLVPDILKALKEAES